MFYKEGWRRNGRGGALLGLGISGRKVNFDSLRFGIYSLNRKFLFSGEQCAALNEEIATLGFPVVGRQTDKRWPYYLTPAPEFRFTGGSKLKLEPEEKLEGVIRYFSELFLRMKKVAPFIDAIIPEIHQTPG